MSKRSEHNKRKLHKVAAQYGLDKMYVYDFPDRFEFSEYYFLESPSRVVDRPGKLNNTLRDISDNKYIGKEIYYLDRKQKFNNITELRNYLYLTRLER